MNRMFEDDKCFLDKLPIGVVITTPEGIILECNTMTLKMFGYDSKEEFLKLSTKALYCNLDDRKDVYRNLYIDNSGSVELFAKRKDSSIFWARVTYIAHKSTKDDIYCLSVVEDLTMHKQAEEDLYLLYAITKGIAESSDLNSAIEATIKILCEITGWIYGEAWIPSADNKYLKFLSAWHNDNKILEKLEIESKNFTFLPKVGFPGFVWLSKKPELIRDITIIKKFPRSRIFNDAGIKSAIFIPIIVDNNVVAIINLLSFENCKDEKRIVNLSSIIASQLGIFFKNKKIEDNLRKSESSLSKAQKIAHIGNWEWNMVKNQAFWSDETYRIFGLPPKEFGATYEAFLNSVHPDDREFVKKSVNKTLYENMPYSIEHRIVLPDGTVRLVHEHAEVIFDSNNKPIQMNGTVQDITERKQIEDQFRKLSHAIEQSILSIIITDIKGNIEYVNPKLLDITGYTREEVIGKNTRIFKSGKTLPETYSDLWNTILSGNDWHGEFLNKKKDGELFWEHASISSIKNEDGIITNFVAYKEDITKLKKLEEQFRQAQKMEAVGQLTGGIAHDFNNILTGIMLSSEFLKLKIDKNNKLRANVEQISELSIKAANLIQGLLAFSRKQAINLQYTNLKDIIANTKKLLSRIIREDIELKFNIPKKDLPIMADGIQIEQILMNLATNARDAMPNGGMLTIEVSDTEIDDNFIKTHGFGKTGRYALISVTDTGIGMDENIQKKIFEPFFTTKEVGKGTGLGLAMVYGLIKQHEGYIDLYSKPGKGTTFKIYLPITELKYEDVKPKEQVIPKRGSETVLVAEDDEPTRKIIINILENYGYKVIETIDGDDALEKFVKNKDRIKLVILDVIMPKKSGKDVYNAITDILPTVKVLFMSGYTGDTLQVKEIAEKGLNFISKPFTQIDLLKKVRYTLDS